VDVHSVFSLVVAVLEDQGAQAVFHKGRVASPKIREDPQAIACEGATCDVLAATTSEYEIARVKKLRTEATDRPDGDDKRLGIEQ
jgi:hypothetical protein